MDIRARLYPHPVLTSYSDDYIDSEFSFNVNIENTDNDIRLKFNIILDNEELQYLINNNSAEYVIHIECTQTCYRKIIHTSYTQLTKNINEDKLRGKVTICLFIVAKKDLENFSSNKFNSDYDGINFDIDRGSVLAVAGQYNIHVEKNTEDTSKIPSIFSINRYDGENANKMEVDIHDHKIIIGLSTDAFGNYKLLSNRADMIPVFHAMIIAPVLMYVFEALSNGMEEYEEYNWYRSLEKIFEKNNLEFSKELLEEKSSYELVNIILDNPVDRALNSIVSLDDGEDD